MRGELIRNLPASIVVLLVALPLCMGVAMASGGTALQGILAGVIGGVVVGSLSGSHVSVSGPAAGLIVIVQGVFVEVKAFDASHYLGVFALVVLVSGLIQIVFAALKLGQIARFIPVSVIKGMLAAIGIMLIMNQFPLLIGYVTDQNKEAGMLQPEVANLFSKFHYKVSRPVVLTLVIGFSGIFLQLIYELEYFKNARWKIFLPAPLVVVILGIGLNNMATDFFSDWAIQRNQMVNIPVFSDSGNISDAFTGLFQSLNFPYWPAIQHVTIWKLAALIALIASVESLLSLEAGDKIDPLGRVSNPNRELLAQGIGNIFSGFIGALPITAVIVRTSANVNAGSTNRLSAILHGFWLLIFLVLAPNLINQIPLSALASVLIFVGYKLAKPSIFKEQYQRGWNVLLPFIFTIFAIIITDLLMGIIMGIIMTYVFGIKEKYFQDYTKKLNGKK